MIKFILGIFSTFLFGSAFADTLTLVAYDPTYYKIIEDLNTTIGHPGILTGVSNIYYYYEPFSGDLTLTQTEWLSTGTGLSDGSGEIMADYESIFHYNGVTFDNMAEMLGNNIRQEYIQELKSQFFRYQLANNTPKIINSMRYVLMQQHINITNLTLNRLRNLGHGRSGGDTPENKFSMWGQTLYNYSKHSGTNGFSSSTFGIALGADNQITNSLIAGFGYNYNSSTISDIDTGNNILFIYGEYQLDKLFIDATIGYNTGFYDCNQSKGKTNGYFGALAVSYNTDFDITPSVAIRHVYNTITPDAKYIDKYNANLMTFVSGATYKYEKDKLSLNAHINLTYDIISPNLDIFINVPELNYTVAIDKDIAPLGLESGLNITLPLGNAQMIFGYDINLRSHYISHTGTIRVRYEF